MPKKISKIKMTGHLKHNSFKFKNSHGCSRWVQEPLRGKLRRAHDSLRYKLQVMN